MPLQAVPAGLSVVVPVRLLAEFGLHCCNNAFPMQVKEALGTELWSRGPVRSSCCCLVHCLQTISLCGLPHTALAQISLMGERAGLQTQIRSQEAGKRVIPPGIEPAFLNLVEMLHQVAEHIGTGSE